MYTKFATDCAQLTLENYTKIVTVKSKSVQSYKLNGIF